MTKNIAISVKNLAKTYTLKRSANTFRNYLGQVFQKEQKKEIEVLKDISFNIEKGQCVGIIGRNGAGKSTLLKILSKIVWPTQGSIQMNGKLSAMLEVGTGFYPDLTGRENIYLSGSLLGMTKNDIDLHLDDIIDFAGVGSYIDSPVRYYSSGMYVRLGFSIASFLKQDILIIDEILAVGDQRFRERCINSMKDDSLNKGKTCLIVSHNMPMIESLCPESIFLKKGQLDFLGDTKIAMKKYLGGQETANQVFQNEAVKISTTSINDKVSENYILGAGDQINISFQIDTKKAIKTLLLRFQIRQGGTNIAVLNNSITNNPFTNVQGAFQVSCTIPRLNLNNGNYTIDLDISDGPKPLFHINSFIKFEVSEGFFFPSSSLPNPTRGACLIDHSWTVHE